MTEMRLQRIKYIRQWRLDSLPENLVFPAEKALVEQIHKNSSRFFMSFAFPYAEHDRYHYYLNFLIEALELLPLKVDLAFDACWRAFESLLFEVNLNPKRSKIQELLSEFCVNYLNNQASTRNEDDLLIARLIDLVPVQTCEYLAQRLLDEYDVTKPVGDSKRIVDRLKWSNYNTNFLALLPNIARKYGAPNINPSDLRKASLLLRKVLRGNSVSIGTFSGQLTVTERLSLIVLGVVYTARNDRFHGSMQPPFKSSVATLRTYAHAHYLYLTSYFLFIKVLYSTGWIALKSDDIKNHLLENMYHFQSLYGKHLEK